MSDTENGILEFFGAVAHDLITMRARANSGFYEASPDKLEPVKIEATKLGVSGFSSIVPLILMDASHGLPKLAMGLTAAGTYLTINSAMLKLSGEEFFPETSAYFAERSLKKIAQENHHRLG